MLWMNTVGHSCTALPLVCAAGGVRPAGFLCGDAAEELASTQGLDYREDIMEVDYEVHKLGGYPTYAQPVPGRPSGYSFVLQISSDETADLSIGDWGNYYFYYNSRKKAWLVHTDSY